MSWQNLQLQALAKGHRHNNGKHAERNPLTPAKTNTAITTDVAGAHKQQTKQQQICTNTRPERDPKDKKICHFGAAAHVTIDASAMPASKQRQHYEIFKGINRSSLRRRSFPLERTFETLKNEIKSCQKCDLCLTRKNTVFGDGIAKTKLLFVGEAPGQMEDEMGLPFVGRSGKLLDKMLAAVDISRTKNMFITNIVKCRPPNNADPTDTQRQACAEYLKQQIDLISPKVIVCVGRIAATSLINPDFRVTKDHGKIYKKGEIDFMGTFHPSALLRFPQNKEEAFKDFLTLKSFLAQLS